MKHLTWLQARRLAREGKAIRREAWRRWLTFESYVWIIGPDDADRGKFGRFALFRITGWNSVAAVELAGRYLDLQDLRGVVRAWFRFNSSGNIAPVPNGRFLEIPVVWPKPLEFAGYTDNEYLLGCFNRAVSADGKFIVLGTTQPGESTVRLIDFGEMPPANGGNSGLHVLTLSLGDDAPLDRRVVQNFDFGADEFMAGDWTDEPWEDGAAPPIPPGVPQPPNPPRPPVPALPPLGNSGEEPDGDGDTPGVQPPTAGSGSDPVEANRPPVIWGGGGGDGPQPPIPPRKPRPHQPPNPNVPTITVEVSSDFETDGPGCFIQPPETCTLYVNVTIAGGPAGVGPLSVDCQGQIQLQSAHPGFNGGFVFENVIVNPGGTITVTADYGAPGSVPLVHTIGTGSITFPPLCLIVPITWTGDTTEQKRCQHGPQGYAGAAEDGYDFAANYAATREYAVHPEPGAGKAGRGTSVEAADENGHNAHGTYTTYPDGKVTHLDWFVSAPRHITCDVGEGAAISNVQPAELDVFGPDEDDDTPPCTFHRHSNESPA